MGQLVKLGTNSLVQNFLDSMNMENNQNALISKNMKLLRIAIVAICCDGMDCGDLFWNCGHIDGNIIFIKKINKFYFINNL